MKPGLGCRHTTIGSKTGNTCSRPHACIAKNLCLQIAFDFDDAVVMKVSSEVMAV